MFKPSRYRGGMKQRANARTPEFLGPNLIEMIKGKKNVGHFGI